MATAAAHRRHSVMGLIGVETGGSLLHDVLPLWADALGLGEVLLRGVDLPPRAGADAVRGAVAALGRDRAMRGALVTGHKHAVFRYAHDLFAGLDASARLLGEVSAIARRDGRLFGAAKDPLTSGLALARLLPRSHWLEQSDAQALLLGAGGACLALAAHLLARPRAMRPPAITMTDIDAARLETAAEQLEAADPGRSVRFLQVDGEGDHDRLLRALPRGSLIVNGTGLGKAGPASPVSGAALFPEQGVVWELNYRGSLNMLAHARAQAQERRLIVADGWLYALYRWAYALADLYDMPMDAARFAELEDAAAPLRPA